MNAGRLARRVHLLLGVFFAPSIVFFATTGAMQVIGLQERREGRAPAAWISHVVEVHKHQKWEPRRRPPAPAAPSASPAASPPAAGAAPAAASETPPTRPGTTVLKGFVLLMSAGLTATTALGLYMAWRVPRDRPLAVALLAAGSLVPAAFLLF